MFKNIFNMFTIRQALRFAVRAAYSQYSICHHDVPFVHKLNRFSPIPNRLLHEGCSNNKELDKLEGKMRLLFTCKKCKTRNSKLISKLAYNKGVIIVRCDGCKGNHLIADNLGWFSEVYKGINIEKIMASKGETVQRTFNDQDGYYEVITNEEYKLHQHNVSKTIESDNNNKCLKKIKELET